MGKIGKRLKAARETKWRRCSFRWNGQANSPEQRRTIPSPPVAVASILRATAGRGGPIRVVGPSGW